VIVLRLYSRPGCHLCEDMKAVVDRVAGAHAGPIKVEEIDISMDAGLEVRYGLEIPVLEIAGRKVAKYRITEPELRQALESRALG
jgi:hypothetical protein